jgi:hypothetical protein
MEGYRQVHVNPENVYRANSHGSFWLVGEKSGVWQKNGLTVDMSAQLVREKAVEPRA